VETLADADALLDRLADATSRLVGAAPGVKIGNQLFTAAGPAAVEHAHKRGCRVFLDLKYHDIPNTVAGAVREATRLGVFMLNVHAAGGVAMMRAATEAATKAARDFSVRRPLVIGVTVLTSLDRKALQHEVGITATVDAHVLALAERARDAGLDGCVASPREIGILRRALGAAWVIVTPGVRPGPTGDAGERPETAPNGSTHDHARTATPRATGSSDDQARTATPRAAIAAGADYIVVGRPITAAPDPSAALAAIIAEIGRA
jgi:orotidine-5'-phosphate decarboxylase